MLRFNHPKKPRNLKSTSSHSTSNKRPFKTPSSIRNPATHQQTSSRNTQTRNFRTTIKTSAKASKQPVPPKPTPQPASNDTLFSKYLKEVSADADTDASSNLQEQPAALISRTQIRSIHDLSYSQLRTTLEQTDLLRNKVDPLKYTAEATKSAKTAPNSYYQQRKAFVGLKPLENLNTLLVHTIDHKKNKHGEVLKSNLVQIPSILGANRSDVVGLWTLRELPSIVLEQQHAFATKRNIPLPKSFVVAYTELQDSLKEKDVVAPGEQSPAKKKKATKTKENGKAKTKPFGSNGAELSDVLDNLESLYHVEFIQSLSDEQRAEFHAEMTDLVKHKLQTGDNNGVKDQSTPYDLIMEYSTTRPQPRIESILPYIHPPTARFNNLTPHAFNPRYFAPVVRKTTRRKTTEVQPTETSNSPVKVKKTLTTPSITIKSEQSYMVSLLSIFSLLPQDILFNNPNSLKISFIGFDYNNTNFIPELIYLCQRFGVNLAISTPSNATQFIDMRLFEQSCLAQGKPIPEPKPSQSSSSQSQIPSAKTKNSSLTKKSAKRLKEPDTQLLEDPELDYSLDEDVPSENSDDDTELDESVYDDLFLLEPKLFIQDPLHGLSPHNVNVDEIKQYASHLNALSPHETENVVEEAPTTEAHMTPNETLQNLRSRMKKAAAAKTQPNQQNPQKSSQTSPTPSKTHDLSEKGLKIYPPIIEYVAHPFSAVQLADIIITNSIFPATTHTYYDHPAYVLDKEMCSFAKDTVKIFHVTEGLSNWQFPNLGVHDVRCMGAQQIEQDNYVIAALAGVVMGKTVM